MTQLVEQAVEAIRKLPPKQQEDVARIILDLAGIDLPVIPITSGEEASFAKARAQAARREFATDAEVQAVWSKHGL